MIIKASAALRNDYTTISELRSRVLQAEQERLSGAKTMSVSEARKALRERLNEV